MKDVLADLFAIIESESSWEHKVSVIRRAIHEIIQLRGWALPEITSDLKPCPFCGSTPIISGYPNISINCPVCHAGIAAHHYDSDLGLMEAVWNKRHP